MNRAVMAKIARPRGKCTKCSEGCSFFLGGAINSRRARGALKIELRQGHHEATIISKSCTFGCQKASQARELLFSCVSRLFDEIRSQLFE